MVAGTIVPVTRTTKTGKVVTRYRDITTGKFVSAKVAAGAAGAGAAIATGVTAANAGKLVGVGGKLVGLGGKLFRFMGGWPGIIITAVSFLLPMIINWIQKHRSSTEENTESIDGLTSEMQAQRAMEQQARNEQETRELRTIVELLTKVVNKESISTVNLNLTGRGYTQSYRVQDGDEVDIDLGLG
jgi:hypothetical protein